MNIVQSYKELINKAREAEEKGDLKDAAGWYKRAIKAEPSEEYPYDRLMIIYRRQKMYKEELQVINEGLKFFEQYHENKQKQLTASNKKIWRLSNAFMKSVGLTDKKGRSTYFPEPVPRWLKRKQVVEKKLAKR